MPSAEVRVQCGASAEAVRAEMLQVLRRAELQFGHLALRTSNFALPVLFPLALPRRSSQLEVGALGAPWLGLEAGGAGDRQHVAVRAALGCRLRADAASGTSGTSSRPAETPDGIGRDLGLRGTGVAGRSRRIAGVATEVGRQPISPARGARAVLRAPQASAPCPPSGPVPCGPRGARTPRARTALRS